MDRIGRRAGARGRRRAWTAAAALACLAGTAHATWSIVIVNTRTREVGVASATCLTGFDLQANTPVVLVGVGGGAAQSAVDADGTNRTFIRDNLFLGVAPAEIVTALASFDPSHQSRQYGIVDTQGRAATFSGSQDGAWAGGRTGQFGDYVYAVQGNVLTGKPVVDAAADALEQTPGDMPEKLMAAMEAARMFGGDGRCSCASGNPTGCGSPPPSFNKSAHIAYLIVARLGDRDGSNGNYRSLSTGSVHTLADVTGDGFPELVSGGSSGLGVRPNMSLPGLPPVFAPYAITPSATQLRGLVSADFNADQAPDLVGADTAGDRVWRFTGTGGLAFLPGEPFPAGDAPSTLGVGDVNRDGLPDVVTLDTTSLTLSVLRNTGTGFAAPTATSVAGGTTLLQVGDLDGDGDADAVVASGTGKQLVIYRNSGDGTLAAEPPIATPAAPTLLLLADINGDQRLDILYVLSGEKQIRVLRQTAQGTFTPSSLSTSQTPTGLAVADIDADGLNDVVFVQTIVGNARLSVLRGQEDGSFVPAVSYPIGFSGSTCLVADLNADGLPDAIVPQTGNAVLNVMYNTGGAFGAITGLAGGDYYLDINIANQGGTAPDPVFQLRERFDAWAAEQSGVPDAAVSEAAFDPPLAWANGVGPALLSVRARDRYGAPVALDPGSVSVTSLEPSPVGVVGVASAGPDGTVVVPIAPGTDCTTERFRVSLKAGSRTIVLTPDATAVYASPADVDRNGFVSGDDFDAFVIAFEAGDASVDVNGDGFMNGSDFDYFIERFVAGC